MSELKKAFAKWNKRVKDNKKLMVPGTNLLQEAKKSQKKISQMLKN